jgi:prolycopene isomerase
VVAVHTEQGMSLTCKAVVSTAAAPALASLLPSGALPEAYQQRLQRPAVAASNVTVFLGLDRDVFAEHGLPHEVVLSPGLDHDAEYAAGIAGDWGQTSMLATDYTRVDPGCAPEGGGVVALTAVAAYDHAGMWGRDDPDAAGAVKRDVGDRLLAVADTWIPGLAAAVTYQEVATPRTNARYTLNTGGSWAGYESRPEVTGPGALGPLTPLPNLLLAGAWTGSFGQSPAMASGVRAARLAERVLTEQD